MWKNGIEWFKSEGAEIVEISLPYTEFALPTYYIIAPAEASANLARYDGIRFGFRSNEPNINSLYSKTRAIGFGKEVKRRLMIGTYVLSAGYYDAYYLKALKVRKLISGDFEKAFKTCDLILTPTTPNVAFPIGEKQTDPIEMYLNDVLTVPASLAGLPAISVSAGFNNEMLPIGLQVIGKPFDEISVLAAGSIIEKVKRVLMEYFIQGKKQMGSYFGLGGSCPDKFKIKAFFRSTYKLGGEPNSQVELVDCGMPGALPVINEYCVEQAVLTGLSLNAEINKMSVFDRKNYFYPDLPQGYQISQFDYPIVGKGFIFIESEGKKKKLE